MEPISMEIIDKIKFYILFKLFVDEKKNDASTAKHLASRTFGLDLNEQKSVYVVFIRHWSDS